jgi:hypothetical protein
MISRAGAVVHERAVHGERFGRNHGSHSPGRVNTHSRKNVVETICVLCQMNDHPMALTPLRRLT